MPAALGMMRSGGCAWLAAADILMWLTFAAIVAMIVAYALERWAINTLGQAAAT